MEKFFDFCSRKHKLNLNGHQVTVTPRGFSLQGRCLDIGDVAVQPGTLWVHALKAASYVDTSCPSATVVLLAQTLIHIWKTKQQKPLGMRSEKKTCHTDSILPGYHSVGRGGDLLFIWIFRLVSLKHLVS